MNKGNTGGKKKHKCEHSHNVNIQSYFQLFWSLNKSQNKQNWIHVKNKTEEVNVVKAQTSEKTTQYSFTQTDTYSKLIEQALHMDQN